MGVEKKEWLPRNIKRAARRVAAVAVAILLLIMLAQNFDMLTDQLSIRLIFMDFSMPMIVFIPLVFLLGMLVGYILRRASRNPKL